MNTTKHENRPSTHDLLTLRLATTKQLVQATSILVQSLDRDDEKGVTTATRTVDTITNQISDLNQRISQPQPNSTDSNEMVDKFFTFLDYFEDYTAVELDHYKGEGDIIAVRMNEVLEHAQECMTDFPCEIELKRALKTSPRLIASNAPTASRIKEGKTFRCWHFTRQGGAA